MNKQLLLWAKPIILGVLCVVAGCSTNKPDPSGTTAEPPHGGGLKIDLPRFQSVEELKAYRNAGEGVESYHLFEGGAAKALVVVTGWGSGAIRDGISVYAYDSLSRMWEPVALWDTKSRGVEVKYDKSDGMIRVLSKNGVHIFSLSLPALEAKHSYDW